jgi:hypothetical protein
MNASSFAPAEIKFGALKIYRTLVPDIEAALQYYQAPELLRPRTRYLPTVSINK